MKPANRKSRCFWGRAFHKASNILADTFDAAKRPLIYVEGLPILFLYRQAAELYLNAIILRYGGNFLPVRSVPARIHATLCDSFSSNLGRPRLPDSGSRGLGSGIQYRMR
jgi:hypothetical protein